MSERFRLEFLHPRHAGTWALLAVLGVAYLIPRRAALGLGAALGRLFYRRNAKRRGIARVNVAMCFPELDARQRESMVREHFEYYGCNVIDFGLVWWAPKRRLDRLVRVHGVEHLDAAYRAGRGAIVITPHAVGMDLGGMYLAHRYEKSLSMMKRVPDALLNWLLQRGRERGDSLILMRDQGLRPLVRSVRAGGVCYFVPDEDFGPEHSVFTPFFGVPTATLTVVARLARMTGAPILTMITRLDRSSGHYTVEVSPALEGFPGGNDVVDAARVNAALEERIRIAPAQYMWTLRWFKTRPDGAASPYDNLPLDPPAR